MSSALDRSHSELYLVCGHGHAAQGLHGRAVERSRHIRQTRFGFKVGIVDLEHIATVHARRPQRLDERAASIAGEEF